MPDLDKPNDARVADGARPALARLDVAVAEFSRAAKRAAADLGLRDVLTGFEAAHAALRETNPTEGLAQDVAAALRGDVAPQVVLDGIEALITRALPTAEAAIDPDLDDATFAQAMVTRQEAREDMAAGAAVTALFDAANEVVRAVERAQPTPDPAPHAPRWSERTLEASHDAFIERLRASTADETGRTRLQRLDDSIAAQPEPT
ncbi:MAG: hypothetical protein KC933_06115, partial [Myxococcales bacterium]|nr:hypothetical protein [Myxococcales bacterium]